jgi:hypothetical protein
MSKKSLNGYGMLNGKAHASPHILCNALGLELA